MKIRGIPSVVPHCVLFPFFLVVLNYSWIAFTESTRKEEKKKKKSETTAVLKSLFTECHTESCYWPRGIKTYSGCQVITELTLDHHLCSQYSQEWQCQLKQVQIRKTPQFIIFLRSSVQGLSKWGSSGVVAARFHWKKTPAVLSSS